ncbi:hypothetical protein ACLQ29_21000 [Micromonospora sp. DT228]|uniref:hypothetical protein n=1 Tax=Micromonospora sp. DT228 TaxID=3393443 RepID=UPI003CF9268A
MDTVRRALGPAGIWSMELRGAARPEVREAARDGIGMFIGFPAYRANLARLGFGEDDLVPGGSDRPIDALRF